MVPYVTVKKYAKWGLLAAIAALGVVYGCDYLWVQARAKYGVGGNPFGTATVYLSAELKSGKVELYYRNPQPIACVNSLFPHLAYSPCWYLRRTPVKSVD